MGTSEALQDENTAYYVSKKYPVVKAVVDTVGGRTT